MSRFLISPLQECLARASKHQDNRSVTTRTKLKGLLARLPSGTPVTSADLAREGVSADLAVHYVWAGWLRRLARGVFVRPDAPLLRDPSLVLLQQQIPEARPRWIGAACATTLPRS